MQADASRSRLQAVYQQKHGHFWRRHRHTSPSAHHLVRFDASCCAVICAVRQRPPGLRILDSQRSSEDLSCDDDSKTSACDAITRYRSHHSVKCIQRNAEGRPLLDQAKCNCHAMQHRPGTSSACREPLMQNRAARCGQQKHLLCRDTVNARIFTS